ncbi:peptidase [Aliinostoc sp. HNIBRCY26]|uniref:peptidase n=1 Tax=Aliinostoc sp. HNIBRCY26 TaxID=3418997 RepID=UPI003D092EB6
MGNNISYPKPNTLNKFINKQLLAALVLAIATGLLVVLTNFSGFAVSPKLPPAKTHPLPPTLAQWQDNTNSGDYFSQIATTEVGYLVWSKFPVKVFIQRPTGINDQQAQVWFNSVLETVQEWNDFLPLLVVESSDIADITIERKTPPLEFSREDRIPRARSALTRYDLYTLDHVLLHRVSILLSPSQTGRYLLAASRHELGHALGIWGHSPLETDALYFSQVRNSPFISHRDVNTLKRIYEQPTSLGFSY